MMKLLLACWLVLGAGVTHRQPTRTQSEGLSQDTLPTVHEIIERYIDAVGGREAIMRLRTRVMRGKLITDLPSRTPPRYEESSVEIRSALPSSFVMTTHGAGGTRVDGFDGITRWSTDGVRVSGQYRVDWRFAWFLNPQHPVRLREYFPRMTLRGVTSVGERMAYVIDIERDESHALYFDVASGLLVRIGYNRELRDYREVDRVRMPFRMVISRKGGSSSYVFDTIEHNVTLDTVVFAVPDTSGVLTPR